MTDQNTAREQAEIKIVKAGYIGFSAGNDPDERFCVKHAIEHIWSGDPNTALALAAGEVSTIYGPSGLPVQPLVSSPVHCFACAEREIAEEKISDETYAGFSDGESWYCVEHTIDKVLDGKWEDLLAFCTGKTTELPDGITSAWHEGSIQDADRHELYKHGGVHCRVGGCEVEIWSGEDEDWEEEEAENE